MSLVGFFQHDVYDPVSLIETDDSAANGTEFTGYLNGFHLTGLTDKEKFYLHKSLT